ncbi:ABC transporter permease [Micromonospora sp. WMMD882]|uniref:ABC transporter permease n=1 Tax=Micromonospora sp. WMMD882 TaxID=3015151 RepID=UPI00248BF726|nr:ABC transporter permease [Micromonospora sp. WMMD882]WBB79010.1 ABC transporter permease [Micromonospora sp. WMMD882]
MTGLRQMLRVEIRLFLREPVTAFMAVGLPALILAGLGAVPALRRPDDLFDGHSLIGYFAPSLLVMTLATAGLTSLANVLAGYRERGVLRRLAVTPARPAALLAAQLLLHLTVSGLAATLLIAVGRVAFGVPLPGHLLGFATAYLLGAAALFALGLLVAAVAPNQRVAGGTAGVLFLLTMFLGGAYLPRFLLPDVVNRVGAFSPPGVQALFDAWHGAPPRPAHLLTMALVALLAGTVAATSFRWE